MNQYLSVSGLNRYLKQRLEQDQNIQNILLKGEVSNFKAHGSGHWYFSLKDASSRVAAVMFASQARQVKFKVEDGMQIIIKASVSIYEATGQYQLYVQSMMLDGVGQLSILFEQNKKRLEQEGLFDVSHKQALPKMPLNIAVITARTGAAIHDILTTIHRRFPIATITLFPCLVQGDTAKYDIVKAIEAVNRIGADAIILGRGGGSIEDLWAFNEPEVVYAIFKSKIPIITGIGHEVDVTLADFVADMRAATPTAAAEMLVPDLNELLLNIDGLSQRLTRVVVQRTSFLKQQLKIIKANRFFQNPKASLMIQKTHVEQLKLQLNRHMSLKHQHAMQNMNIQAKLFEQSFQTMYDKKRMHFHHIIAQLDLLSPLKTLTRGYGVIKDHDNIIQSIDELSIGQHVTIQLRDGSATAIIDKKENTGE